VSSSRRRGVVVNAAFNSAPPLLQYEDLGGGGRCYSEEYSRGMYLCCMYMLSVLVNADLRGAL
jgi:hypothetical protein